MTRLFVMPEHHRHWDGQRVWVRSIRYRPALQMHACWLTASDPCGPGKRPPLTLQHLHHVGEALVHLQGGADMEP